MEFQVGTARRKHAAPPGSSSRRGTAEARLFMALRIPATCIAAMAFAGSGCSDSHPILATAPPTELPAQPIEEPGHAVYFFAPGCPDCQDVEQTVLPELTGRGVVIEKVNVETPEGLESLRSLKNRLGTRLDVLAPIIMYQGRMLRGSDEIHDFFLVQSIRDPRELRGGDPSPSGSRVSDA